MKKFTNKEIEQAREYYGFECESIISMPEIWTRCEVCGKPLFYDTSVYCENECISKKNKRYKDENGYKYEARFCWDCLKKIDSCPICGEKKFGR